MVQCTETPSAGASKEDDVADSETIPEGVARALAGLGSATLGESGGRAAHRRLRPAWPGAAIAAPAYPAQCTPGDNLAVHVAVTKAPTGSVLVVDVGQVADRGYWGEVLTTAAEAAGLVGLVLDGGVRDVGALEAHGFPVFSAGIALTGATKDKPGTVGQPVRVGGVVVAAGDWVVGDVDGVTFIPAGAVDEILAAGRAREAKEAGFFEALRSGRTTVELLGLDSSLISGTEE
jgi:4-hydroxy-4-methyl-2-oxoglutarate aldolase